jgi:hypothetical protein
LGTIIGQSECLLAAVNIERVAASNQIAAASQLKDGGTQLGLPTRSYDFAATDASTIDWATRELVQLARPENRSRLVVAGAYVESHITFLTLRALAEGFDVYLLSDLLNTREKRYARIFQMRLYQAGAVPTTMSQVVMEWRTSTDDKTNAGHLDELLRIYHQQT